MWLKLVSELALNWIFHAIMFSRRVRVVTSRLPVWSFKKEKKRTKSKISQPVIGHWYRFLTWIMLWAPEGVIT